MNDQQILVHKSHCCKKHGCKYGDNDCPVELGEVIQDHPCESCSREQEDPLYQRVNALECTLRDIALYLGVGGYSCDEVNPQKFFDKIKWGIDDYAQNYHELQKTLETKKFKEQCAAITADALSDWNENP